MWRRGGDGFSGGIIITLVLAIELVLRGGCGGDMAPGGGRGGGDMYLPMS